MGKGGGGERLKKPCRQPAGHLNVARCLYVSSGCLFIAISTLLKGVILPLSKLFACFLKRLGRYKEAHEMAPEID
jgi:hypothetical protein